MKYADPRLVEHLASGYVLGTLSGSARRRFERLLRDRVDVQLAVAQWEHRLGQLAGPVQALRPSPRVWQAIAQRTRAPAQDPTQAHVGAPAAGRPVVAGWGWLKLAGTGLAGVAAGAVITIALLFSAPGLLVSSDHVAMRTGERLPQSYVGLLTDGQGNGKLLVSSLRHGRTMTVKVIGPLAPPADGSRLVLWAVPANAPAFVLGDVPASGSAVSVLPDTSEKLLSKVTRLMVTAETAARPASPGAVLFSGNCAKLW